MSEGVFICAGCKTKEKDHKKIIECANCHNHHHLKCKAGAFVRHRNRKYCSVSCQESGEPDLGLNPKMDQQQYTQIINEIKDSRKEMAAEMQKLRTEVKTTVENIEKFQNFLSGKLDDLIKDIKELWEDHRIVKGKVSDLEARHLNLQATVARLELEVDRINRSSISRNMIVLGVPAKSNEDTSKIVQLIAAAVDCNIPPNAISEATRMPVKDSKQQPGRSQPIKVVFTCDRYKEELLDKKRKKGPLLLSAIDATYSGTNRVLLRDELTPYGLNLLQKVREVQEMLNWKYVWPGRYGAILVKKTEISKTTVIRTLQDAADLERLNNKRGLNSSPGNSSGSGSPGSQHESKRRL